MVSALMVGCGGGGGNGGGSGNGGAVENITSVAVASIKGHKVEVPYEGGDIVVEFFCDGGYTRYHTELSQYVHKHYEYHEPMTHIRNNKLYLDELYEDIYGPGHDLLVTNADNISIVDNAIVVGVSQYYVKSIGDYDISKITKVNNCN